MAPYQEGGFFSFHVEDEPVGLAALAWEGGSSTSLVEG